MLVKNNYYSLKNILKEKTTYNVIFDDKTYAVLSKILADFWESSGKNQGAIIRRWREDFMNKGGATLFNNHISNGFISKLTNDTYNTVVYYRRSWYLAKIIKDDEDTEKTVRMEHPFAYSFALTEMEHDKSASFPDVTNILYF